MTPVQQLFLKFIHEREDARVAKEHGIHPHSDDPVIRDFKFCNINREHDRVTRWVKEHIRDNPRINMLGRNGPIHHLAVARVFNHPPTLEAILAVPHPPRPGMLLDAWAARIHELKKEAKVFRGAYKMPAHGSGGMNRSSIDYFFDGIKQIWAMDFSHCTRLQEVSELIQTAHGFGPFLANQIVTDLRYTEFFREAPDWETYVLCGPGTKKGLCRFFGMKPRKGGAQKTALRQLAEANVILRPHLGRPFTEYFRDPNNLTNSFCEFSKYARALDGGAPPKSKYRPT